MDDAPSVVREETDEELAMVAANAAANAAAAAAAAAAASADNVTRVRIDGGAPGEEGGDQEKRTSVVMMV